MNRQRMRELLKRLPKNNQKGFTLIELLVVISILGILAAVVTMSMVGITKVANDRAGATEKQVVQVAYDTMLEENGVDISAACTGAPSTAGTATKGHDRVPQHDGIRRGQHNARGGQPVPALPAPERDARDLLLHG